MIELEDERTDAAAEVDPAEDDDVTCRPERSQGKLCMLCYQGEVLVDFSCVDVPRPDPPPEPEPEPEPQADAMPKPAPPRCFLTRESSPCVYCAHPDGERKLVACLQCKEADVNTCRMCWWSDQDPQERLCKACPGVDGGTVSDCEALRPEPNLSER